MKKNISQFIISFNYFSLYAIIATEQSPHSQLWLQRYKISPSNYR